MTAGWIWLRRSGASLCVVRWPFGGRGSFFFSGYGRQQRVPLSLPHAFAFQACSATSGVTCGPCSSSLTATDAGKYAEKTVLPTCPSAGLAVSKTPSGKTRNTCKREESKRVRDTKRDPPSKVRPTIPIGRRTNKDKANRQAARSDAPPCTRRKTRVVVTWDRGQRIRYSNISRRLP